VIKIEQNRPDRPLDTPSAHADRLLEVFEAIAKNGPITLNRLESMLAIPRVSIWRATQSLRARSWVRVRYGDSAFEVSHIFDRLFSDTHVGLPECEDIDEIMPAIVEHKRFHGCVGIFAGTGRVLIIEDTALRSPVNSFCSLVFNEIALAAQLTCTQKELVRHLEVYLRSAPPEERQIIESGEHGRRLAALAKKGLVWSDDGTSCVIPWRFQTGSPGSLQVRLRVYGCGGRARLASLVQDVVLPVISRGETKPLLFNREIVVQ
jgi:hypothetical protein